jgi:magnesium-transporting ATPase (P-type)
MNTFKHTDSRPWHTLAAEKVLAHFGTDEVSGLSEEKARALLERHGPNRLSPPRRKGPLLRFLLQFHDVLIYVLLASAAVTALLGDWVDTAVILGVVLINGIIGFVQEGKAEQALLALSQMLSLRTQAVRDARELSVASEDLVPGDVVVLRAGDKVPADLRLIWVKNLRIDEAALTGESMAVEKSAERVPLETLLTDRTSMAYAGTLVTYGQARGVIVATGDRTEIGRIRHMLEAVPELVTPLLRQINRFGRWLSAGIIALAALTFVFGVFVRGFPQDDMFMAAVSLAVAAIPEGLPAVLTITLAMGVQRMARRNAIVRRLPAVETLGSVTVICTDKTGTLTRNEMTVRQLVTADGSCEVDGAGYDPRGDLRHADRTVAVNDSPDILELGRAGLLCNEADVRLQAGAWVPQGDPMEAALITLALKLGLDPPFERKELPRADVIPFESEHRFMASLHHDHSGHGFIYLKGAPERVFEMCQFERRGGEDKPLNLRYWHREVERAAQGGLRTLALAFKTAAPQQRELSFADVETGFSLLGLCGIADPPRPEAIVAVRQCQRAGIRVKMITGDHATTALAIGQEMRIGSNRRALTGAELDKLDDQGLHEAAGEVDVFARVSPEHKLKLVRALQGQGQIVAMTGDGVNDAPALKQADIGIAMGQKGTEVAKETAEMVLADDNFASIAQAVEEGRTVYDNIRKTIGFMLPTSGGEALILIAAIVAGDVLPITPLQILWVNMITAVTLALALAFEAPEDGVMRRPPRSPNEPILSVFLTWRVVFVSMLMVIGAFGLFHWALRQQVPIEYARTIVVNTLVMIEAIYLINSRYLYAPSLSFDGLLGNRWVLISIGLIVVIQILFTYTPWMQFLFLDRCHTDLVYLHPVDAILVSCARFTRGGMGVDRPGGSHRLCPGRAGEGDFCTPGLGAHLRPPSRSPRPDGLPQIGECRSRLLSSGILSLNQATCS